MPRTIRKTAYGKGRNRANRAQRGLIEGMLRQSAITFKDRS